MVGFHLPASGPPQARHAHRLNALLSCPSRFLNFTVRANIYSLWPESICLHSVESVDLFFVPEGEVLGLSCERFDWQLSFLKQISSQQFLLSSPAWIRSPSTSIIKSKRGKKTWIPNDGSNSFSKLLMWSRSVFGGLRGRQLVPGIVQGLVTETWPQKYYPSLPCFT
jgi:hypothetical protein